MTARPTAAPLNSTFTVMADAERAGWSLGAMRGGGRPRPMLRAGGESARDAAESEEAAPPPGSPRNLERGAIQEGALGFVASSLEAGSMACAFEGFIAISLTLEAIVGSRMTSFNVTRNAPSSVKTSLTSLSRPRRSRRVHVVVTFSSSRKGRKWFRNAFASLRIALTVERERWLTSAPRRR